MQANAQRIERIESRLETLIENQQGALGELNSQRPGFFASSATKAGWAAEIEAAQDRLQTLRGRLSRLEEIKEQSEELAEDKMRQSEPDLAKRWDVQRRAQRGGQEQNRQAARTKARSAEQAVERGRELEI